MPAATKPLTDARILAEPFPEAGIKKLADGFGLYLELRSTGTRIWRYRYRLAGKEQTYTIGEYGKAADQFGIKEAREELRKQRAKVELGQQATQQRAIAKAAVVVDSQRTFRAAAKAWMDGESKRCNWSRQYVYQSNRALRQINAQIGNLPLSAITPLQCLAVTQTAGNKASWASFLRMTMSRVFRHDCIDSNVAHDPARAISRRVPKPRNPRPNKWLYMKDVPAFIDAVRHHPDIPRAERLGVLIVMLTLVRPGELAAAEWSQFDLEGKAFGGPTWYVPDSAMKMETPHLVPLSRQAVELLRELRAISGDTPFLFPLRRSKARNTDSRRGDSKTVDSDRFAQAIRGTEFKGRLTAHGLRHTASTFLNSIREYRGDPVELQLAHLARGSDSQAQIRAIYNHAALMDERRPMMQAYADACMPRAKKPTRKGSNVVPLRRAA